MIRFFNTLSGKVEDFFPIHPGEVKLYTCGPTVYDYPHIGNDRAYVFEDLLKRFLLFMGFHVRHVMNITDVEDKIIRNSQAMGMSLADYTRIYAEAFFEDNRTLNILPADVYPRATEHIQGMVEMVKGLVEKGFAYEKDGSYYFSIAKFPRYGRLSKINLDELKTGVRVDADEYEKEAVHDFALWKKAKVGEPAWQTELGPGRPGWHIECSVMSSKYLGRTFDIHCGGVDNIFPHHENEIAQSEAYWGEKFVNYWLHCHHLMINGEKMAKSKGNFTTLRALMEKGADPMAVRFLLLSTHYRKSLNFTLDALDQAQSALKRIKDFIYELETRPFPERTGGSMSGWIADAEKKFKAGLSDDLNISLAVTAVFDFIKKVNVAVSRDAIGRTDARDAIRFIRTLDAVLGVLPAPKEETLPAEILKKIEAREEARKNRNFSLADGIRKELLDLGIVLEDTKDGVRWKIEK